MPRVDILPLRGAFPQLNPVTGAVCVETVGRWQERWLDAERTVWQDGSSVRIGTPGSAGEVVYGRGVPRLGAGGGQWCASMQPRPGVSDGLWLNGTEHLDGVGGVLGADAYNYMSADGDVLWLSPFQSEDKALYLSLANPMFGPETIELVGRQRGLECARMSGDLVTWRRGGDGTVWAGLFDRFDGAFTWTKALPDLGEPTIAPIPLVVGDELWILRQYQQRGGYCLHPVEGEPIGYRVDGIDTFNPDAIVLSGQILVVSQQRVGEAVELRTFDVSEQRIDLSALPDLPVTDPGRPFFLGLFHHHYDRTLHPTWGTLELHSELDVISDPIAPIWPSLIGPDAIRVAPNDKHLVQGLFVSAEGVGPEVVERQITLVRELWTTRHPGAGIPPVVVYLTEGQRLAYGNIWANATSADIWAPECYFDLTFPAEPVDAIAQERLAWLMALGQRRPILAVCQAFDRNGAHTAHMGTVAHLLPEYLTEWSSSLNCKGLLFFDCNRSGLKTYPELRRHYERIAAVCTPPAQLHPWTPAPNPQAPPRIAVRASQTIVRQNDIVTFRVERLPGSGPVNARVEWFVDEIGDGQGPGFHSETTAFALRVAFPITGQYRFSAKVIGPGGEDTSDESDSPLITVEPAEEPEMKFPTDQQQADFLHQLQVQGYGPGGFLGREEGLFTSGSPEDLVSPRDPNKRVDKVGLAVWQGRFNQFFSAAPSNARPDVHNWAMRHALRQVWESGEAQANPNRPPLPEHWNESFDVPPLLPSSR